MVDARRGVHADGGERLARVRVGRAGSDGVVDGGDDVLGQREHGLEDPAPVVPGVVEPTEPGQAVAHRAGRGLEPGKRHRHHLHRLTSMVLVNVRQAVGEGVYLCADPRAGRAAATAGRARASPSIASNVADARLIRFHVVLAPDVDLAVPPS